MVVELFVVSCFLDGMSECGDDGLTGKRKVKRNVE